jgi:hypothetical protein
MPRELNFYGLFQAQKLVCHDVEALISKIDLLKKINNRLYDLEEGRIIL